MKHLLVFAVLCAIAVSPLTTSAQEIPVSSSTATHASADGSQLESCFDYYQFGSVPVTISSETLQVSQGALLLLKATVTNNNGYPVDDVGILGKVFYKKDFKKNSFGPDVIQQLTLANHLSLMPGESKTLTYTWAVPPNLKPGNYQIAGYVDSHDRFNLAGLPFTNDVVGTLFNFSVVGIDKGAVRFNNTETYVNGTNYHSAVFSPKTDNPLNGVPVVATIDNTTHAFFSGKVVWKLYSWDGSNPANLISQSDQDVHVNGSGSTTITYLVKDSNHTVYYLTGELMSSSGEVLSVLPTRWVLSRGGGLDLSRFSFFGATASSTRSHALTAFACVHSTGHEPSQNVTVEVSATPLDPVSWLMHLGSLGHVTYKGAVSTQLSAVSIPLASAPGNFRLTAKLYQNGKLLDSVSSTYSCQDFHSCSLSTFMDIALLVIGILIIILCLYFLRRRRPQGPASLIHPNVV